MGDTDTVVITGGYGTYTTVAVYSDQGWLGDLPSLNIGRDSHACTSYMSGAKRMLLVSGGADGNYLDSTEIFDPSLGSWRAGAALPSPRMGLRATNIDNRVLLFGGSDGSYLDTILEYDITGDSYTQIGTMTQARGEHAISVVKYQDFSEWCQ